ncbi:MAG: helix-turn-helix domain-containing protein, partial [Ruminococcus sp.]|nr:helix-turn-helix domain-containing protein [Ruminococcus sp.]
MEIIKKIENVLEVEGVNAAGFGVLAQAVMFDIDISVTSKAIYAYLCSYLGSGRAVFPKVSTIISDLKIAENTYYKHFKPLVENGYIKVSKANGFLNKNVYTIYNNVSKLKVPVYSSDSNKSLLALDGINASGYGFIPKLIMRDRRLTVKAKALIAFLYSVAQAGSCAYPHRTTICTFLGISKDVYYKALNQLIEYNYITVRQRHGSHGRFTVNDYILNSNPKTNSKKDSPCPENCGNEENGINSDVSPCPDFCGNGENGLNSDVSPCPSFCGYDNSHRVREIEVLPCPENCGNNNSTSNNSKSNIIILPSSNLKVETLQVDDEPDV